MDRKTMIEELERIADRMMHGKTTLSDPDALLRMAHDLRKPEERDIHEAHIETDLASAAKAIGRKGGASKSPAKGAASKTNGAKGGRPRSNPKA